MLYSRIINYYTGTAFCSPDSPFDTPERILSFLVNFEGDVCAVGVLKRFNHHARTETRNPNLARGKDYYYQLKVYRTKERDGEKFQKFII